VTRSRTALYGGGGLRDLLKQLTPSGRRDVEQLWWELRMAVLRVMNRPDEFELTALDFCVTYEVSPPGWERPRCHFQSVNSSAVDPDEGGSIGAGRGGDGAGAVGLHRRVGVDRQTSEFNHLGLVELSGRDPGRSASHAG
jgi:hypothetical protein